MGDKAGRWFRVSTGKQDEDNQVPDVDVWCDSHDYDVAQTYILHGKSAFKGSN
jgi:DNA invertase Pin-like site-specific DNA recombinase